MSRTELNVVSTYKDSGVPWLGIIPAGWDVIRLKDVGESIIGLTYAPEDVLDDDAGVLVLRSSNIQQGELSLQSNVYVSKKIPKNLTLQVGDILICSRNGSRNLIGKNITIDERTVGQTFGAFMTVYRSKYSNFLRYFFNSRIFESQSGLYMSSTINQLTINTLNNFSFVLPSANEQAEIASYLDIKTAQIDRRMDLLIRKAENYGKLKQSLINEAVTRGLDKSVPLQDAGLTWIGSIPQHWCMKRIKEVCEINKQTLTDKTSPSYEFDYVDIGSVTYGIRGYVKERMTFATAPSRAKRIAKRGDTIISTVRTYLKAITTIDTDVSDLIVSTGFAVITPKKMINERFCSYLMISNSIIDRVCALSTGVSYPATNATAIGDLLIQIPPIQEQILIGEYLDEKTEVIEKILDAINAQIDLLKELRKSLINDVVTGKIKVVSDGV